MRRTGGDTNNMGKLFVALLLCSCTQDKFLILTPAIALLSWTATKHTSGPIYVRLLTPDS